MTEPRAIDENTITDAALDQMAGTTDPRLKQIMESLVSHLHQFARDVDLTPEEWIKGIEFLTNVGKTCTPVRQEFILMSDTLGMSTLINALHDKRSREIGTKTSLLGPFYRADSPKYELGGTINTREGVPEIAIYGQITDLAGKAIPNASIQIWQTDDEGVYDLQKQDPSIMDTRGQFTADAEGKYNLRTVCPLGYMIPMDGPVGDMIRAQKRHGFRPAHIHFLIGAPGYRELVTALYLRDDYVGSDTVFGVTDSLITEVKNDDASSPIPNLPSIGFNFSLGREAEDEMSGRVGADPSQIGQTSH
jgi:hydroxyquinol 1,2-dioxygenase